MMGYVARGVDNIDVGAMLQQVVIYVQSIRQGRRAVSLCRGIQRQQIAHWGRSLISTTALFLH